MKKISSAILLLVMSIVLLSCEKDESSEPKLVSASEKLTQSTQEFKNEEGNKAVDQIVKLEHPALSKDEKKSAIPTWILKPSLDEMKKQVSKKNFITNVDLLSLAGTYTWNATTSDWDYLAQNPSDQVVVLFPSEGSSTNNCQLTVHSITETEVSSFFVGTVKMATAYQISIKVDEKDVYHLNYRATVSDDGEVLTMNITTTVGQFVVEYELGIINEKLLYKAKFSKANETLLQMEYDISKYLLSEGAELNSTIIFADTKVVTHQDVYKMFMLQIDEGITNENLNEIVDMTVYSYPANEKLGEVIFTIDSKQQIGGTVNYEDGSTEDYLTFISKLQTVIGDVFTDDIKISF